MTAPVVQINYETMQGIAQAFEDLAQATYQTQSQINDHTEALRQGWIGEGADAFFQEMTQEVLPRVGRLREALLGSAQTARTVMQILQEAEQEAGNLFRGDSGDEIASSGAGFMASASRWNIRADQKAKLWTAITQWESYLDQVEALWRSTRGAAQWQTAKLQAEQTIMQLRHQYALDRIDDLQGLNPQNWARLNLQQRAQLVQTVSALYASSFNTTTPPVTFKNMPPQSNGVYKSATHSIELNTLLLQNNNPGGVINTIVHETRHAFQYSAMRAGISTENAFDFVPDSLHQQWINNSRNYVSPQQNYDRYRNQPLEADAFAIGDHAQRYLYN